MLGVMTFGIQMFRQMTVRSEMLRQVTFGIQTILVTTFRIQMFGRMTSAFKCLK